MVRALVVHIIVLAPAFNHLQVALGAIDPREVTLLGRARGCDAHHLQMTMGRGEEAPPTAEDCCRCSRVKDWGRQWGMGTAIANRRRALASLSSRGRAKRTIRKYGSLLYA